jgi:hypothetical protein
MVLPDGDRPQLVSARHQLNNLADGFTGLGDHHVAANPLVTLLCQIHAAFVAVERLETGDIMHYATAINRCTAMTALESAGLSYARGGMYRPIRVGHGQRVGALDYHCTALERRAFGRRRDLSPENSATCLATVARGRSLISEYAAATRVDVAVVEEDDADNPPEGGPHTPPRLEQRDESPAPRNPTARRPRGSTQEVTRSLTRAVSFEDAQLVAALASQPQTRATSIDGALLLEAQAKTAPEPGFGGVPSH